MKTFLRSLAAGVFLLLLGLSTSDAQEVTFTAGPSVTATGGAGNGGFAWGDLDGSGNLSIFIPYNIVELNSITAFTKAASTATANIPINTNSTGLLLADFNGDGVPDLFTTNGGNPSTSGVNSSLFYDSAGVFILATGVGDLATAGATGEVFQGASAAPIDHSNYLSIAYPGGFTGIAGSNQAAPVPPNGGVWLLKGGPTGFTDIGKGAAAGNLGIDSTLSYESWDVRFFDANNDGYLDLLMPSFRNGFSKIDTGTSGARKGCVMLLNDGTGKFIIPTAATLGRSIYALDSVKLNKAGTADSIEYSSVHGDTGIIVDDTVRHFAAIGEQWGDLNNDGIEDLVLNGLNATDNRDGNDTLRADVILYGKGDGTFTYKWDGVHVVANNGLVQSTAQRAISIGDYNNDGLLDIYTAQTFTPQHLYRNNGDGTFTDIASTDGVTGGPGTQRGAQLVDYDNDGFLDVFVYTGGNTLLLKNGGNTNNWIAFKPIGTGNNKSAIGAKFTVWTGGHKQIREISASGGSAGMGGTLRANFGLGTATAVDSVHVQWPDGNSQTLVLKDGVNRYYTVREGDLVPAVPVLVSPKNDSTGAPTSMTLNWNSSANAAHYQVQLSLDRTFATNVVANDSSLTTTSKSVSGLGYSSWYYWRVLAYDTFYTSGYSVVDSFQTIVQAPTAVPTLLSPANNATNQPYKLKLVISKTSDAAQYNWQVTTDGTFGSTFAVNDSTIDTTNTVTLAGGTKYFWRVRGVNPGGAANFSSADTFTVMTVPAVAVLAFPAQGQVSIPADTLVLKWHSVAADTGYICQISTSKSFSSLVFTSDTTRDTTFKATSLQTLTWYYWRVASYNAGGASAFTAVDSFQTIVPIPAAPLLSSPLASATGVARLTTFVWRSVTYASKYHLQVSTANDFSAVVRDTTVGDTTATLTNHLDASTRYYWHVSAIDTAGEGAFASTRLFTTGLVDALNEQGGPPKEFALFQNYPNPFNPSTMINYDIPKNAYVKVVIYDVLGRVVATLVNGVQQPSHYSVEWNPAGLSSGIYFCRIQAQSQDGSGNFVSVKKLVYMK
ncbi:MAG TPA: FG-GAP-like repeat-containing protein [Candidatus Acidoferrales bacterium]|nr:FG-GAP-like repeat-containing protein [Candidatus Acidoferrales bacterium]